MIENPAELRYVKNLKIRHIRYREYFLRILLADDILIKVLNKLDTSVEHKMDHLNEKYLARGNKSCSSRVMRTFRIIVIVLTGSVSRLRSEIACLMQKLAKTK